MAAALMMVPTMRQTETRAGQSSKRKVRWRTATRHYHHAAGRFPLPTTEEWGEGKGEGIPISRANSMETAPLPSPLPARASQGEGEGACHGGGGIQVRPPPSLPVRQTSRTFGFLAF